MRANATRTVVARTRAAAAAARISWQPRPLEQDRTVIKSKMTEKLKSASLPLPSPLQEQHAHNDNISRPPSDNRPSPHVMPPQDTRSDSDTNVFLVASRIALWIGLVLGLVFFHWAAFGCQTFDYVHVVGNNNNENIDVDNASPSSRFDVGYWSLKGSSENDNGGQHCTGYRMDASQVAGWWKLGRMVTVLGAILIWMTVLVALVLTTSSLVPTCRRLMWHDEYSHNPRVVQRWLKLALSVAMMLIALHCALLLIGLATDSPVAKSSVATTTSLHTKSTLNVGTGAILAIVATIIWLLNAILLIVSDSAILFPTAIAASRSTDKGGGGGGIQAATAKFNREHQQGVIVPVASTAASTAAPASVAAPAARSTVTAACNEHTESETTIDRGRVVGTDLSTSLYTRPNNGDDDDDDDDDDDSVSARIIEVSLNNVALTGARSQTAAGAVTANPPIMNTTVTRMARRGKIYWFPYGLHYIAPAACTVLGLIFFHVAAFGCSLFRTDVWGILGGDNGYTIGYWNVEDPDGGGCLDYDSNFADSSTDLPAAWKIGRAAGVLGALLAWIVLALVGVASFYCYPRPILTFRLIGWSMIGLSPTSLLLLIGKATEDGKYFKLAAGGILAILSSILWVGGAVATMRFIKERPVSLSPTVPVSSRHATATDNAARQSNLVGTSAGARSPLVQQSIDTMDSPSATRQSNAPAAFTTTNTMPTGTTTTVAQYLRENTYLFPYGLRYIAPAVCTALGLIFFHVAAFGCATFKTDVSSLNIYGTGSIGDIGTDADDIFATSALYDDFIGVGFHSTTVGYWKFESPFGGGCISYMSFKSELSGAFKFGRFIGVVGSFLIWAILALVASASVVRLPRSKLVFRVTGGCMAVASVLSLLLLVGVSAEGGDYLKLGAGGVLAIFSFFIWLGGAVAIVWFMSERPRASNQSATTSVPMTLNVNSGHGVPTPHVEVFQLADPTYHQHTPEVGGDEEENTDHESGDHSPPHAALPLDTTTE